MDGMIEFDEVQMRAMMEVVMGEINLNEAKVAQSLIAMHKRNNNSSSNPLQRRSRQSILKAQPQSLTVRNFQNSEVLGELWFAVSRADPMSARMGMEFISYLLIRKPENANFFYTASSSSLSSLAHSNRADRSKSHYHHSHSPSSSRHHHPNRSISSLPSSSNEDSNTSSSSSSSSPWQSWVLPLLVGTCPASSGESKSTLKLPSSSKSSASSSSSSSSSRSGASSSSSSRRHRHSIMQDEDISKTVSRESMAHFVPLEKMKDEEKRLLDNKESDTEVVAKLALHVLVLVHGWHLSTSMSTDESMLCLLTETSDLLEDLVGWNVHTAEVMRIFLFSLCAKVTTMSRDLLNDVHHPAWSSLFGLLVFIEDFIFFSGIPHMYAYADQNHMIVPRAKILRHFKESGLHLSVEGASQDLILIQKVVALLDSLKFQEVEKMKDDTIDKEALKRRKERGLEEVAFFKEAMAYHKHLAEVTAKKDGSDSMLKIMSTLLSKRLKTRAVAAGVEPLTLRRRDIEEQMFADIQQARKRRARNEDIPVKGKMSASSSINTLIQMDVLERLRKARQGFQNSALAATQIRETRAFRPLGLSTSSSSAASISVASDSLSLPSPTSASLSASSSSYSPSSRAPSSPHTPSPSHSHSHHSHSSSMDDFEHDAASSFEMALRQIKSAKNQAVLDALASKYRR